jgi:hypothetical protein
VTPAQSASLRRFAHHPVRIAAQGFLLIAEPRVLRTIQFLIYMCMIASGGTVLADRPASFEDVLGGGLVVMLGGFIALGGLLGAFAILPGIWWLEKAALASLMSGLVLYAIIVVVLGISATGFWIGVAFALSFLQRYREIRPLPLAPKRG